MHKEGSLLLVLSVVFVLVVITSPVQANHNTGQNCTQNSDCNMCHDTCIWAPYCGGPNQETPGKCPSSGGGGCCGAFFPVGGTCDPDGVKSYNPSDGFSYGGACRPLKEYGATGSFASVCKDGKDNDKDGLADCADSDCSSLAECQLATVKVTSPNGGETWTIGSTVTITWTSTNVNYVYLDLTNSAGGYSYGDSITNLVNVEGNTGQTSWTIPTYAKAGTYKMKIGTCSTKTNRNDCSGSISDVYDYSDGTITLVAATTTTTSGCSTNSDCAIQNPSWAGATFCDSTGLKLMQYRQSPTCQSGTCIYTTSELAVKEECSSSGKICDFTTSSGGVYACLAGAPPITCPLNTLLATRCVCGSNYADSYNIQRLPYYCCGSGSSLSLIGGGTCPTPSPTVSGDWTFCASENQYCSFSGLKEVRYGANGQYFYAKYNGGVPCTNSNFVDPIVGTVKQCHYRDTTITPLPHSNITTNITTPLDVSSTPTGATVTNMDSGSVYCQSTPCYVSAVTVPSNLVNIRISKAGYYDWTNIVYFYSGETTIVKNATLIPISTSSSPSPSPTTTPIYPTPTTTPYQPPSLSCSTDSDCSWTITNSCPESAGAAWDCASKYNPITAVRPPGICPQVLSTKPQANCGCIQNRCSVFQFEKPTEPPRKIGTTDFDTTKLFAAVIQMEQLTVKFNFLKSATNKLANYYNSTGNTQTYNVWLTASQMIEQGIKRIEELRTEVRNKLDTFTIEDLRKLKSDIKSVINIIKEIVRSVLSLPPSTPGPGSPRGGDPNQSSGGGSNSSYPANRTNQTIPIPPINQTNQTNGSIPGSGGFGQGGLNQTNQTNQSGGSPRFPGNQTNQTSGGGSSSGNLTIPTGPSGGSNQTNQTNGSIPGGGGFGQGNSTNQTNGTGG